MKTPPSPFPLPVKERKRINRDSIDPSLMSVEHNTPVPTRRSLPEGKYSKLFARMRPGSCVKCESSEVHNVASAMRKAIKAMPALSGCMVVTRALCDDGHGRVWAAPK